MVSVYCKLVKLETSNQSVKGAANQSQGQQRQITDVQTKTIDKIMKHGLDPNTIEKIHADKAEMDRRERENAEKIEEEIEK